jgi:hypothetical protein
MEVNKSCTNRNRGTWWKNSCSVVCCINITVGGGEGRGRKRTGLVKGGEEKKRRRKRSRWRRGRRKRKASRKRRRRKDKEEEEKKKKKKKKEEEEEEEGYHVYYCRVYVNACQRLTEGKYKPDRRCSYNVILRRVCTNIVTKEKQ